MVLNRTVSRIVSSRKAAVIARAKSGDPLSIGLILLYIVYRMAKRRSSGKAYVAKLLPGQTISISNLPKESKRY